MLIKTRCMELKLYCAIIKTLLCGIKTLIVYCIDTLPCCSTMLQCSSTKQMSGTRGNGDENSHRSGNFFFVPLLTPETLLPKIFSQNFFSHILNHTSFKAYMTNLIIIKEIA